LIVRRIALHDYLSQIEGLLDDNRLPEAAAHCHFVLQQYPRHIGAYRLFGRALLEQQLYDDAIDIFERLLGADPEDLISHAGLALAYSESRDLERAIWHMERAFEVDPYNRAIQDELRKLYEARDGDAPPRLALTRAALARLHLRGALYQQAAAEFTGLLAEYPDRIDLQLALAETLYLDARIAEAADVCQKVLEVLPFCIKANAMLADACLQDEQVNEAREYLRHLQELTMLDRTRLDPDTTLGRALSNPRISLPEVVRVEILEDSVAFAKDFEDTGEWPEQTTAVVVDGVSVPDWLQEVGSPEATPAKVETQSEQAEPESTEFIDWLDEADTPVMSPLAERPERSVAADSENLDEEETPVELELLERPDEFAGTLDEMQSAGSGFGEDSLQTAPSAETEPALGDTPAPEDENERAGEDAAAPIWENEELLALHDLRSFVDDDSQPSVTSNAAPEWLDELSEREDVADELPEWLYEAVGLDAEDSSGVEAAGLQQPLDSLDQVNDQQDDDLDADEGSGEEEFHTASREIGGRRSDPDYHADELPELALGSTVPEWLLEGDDVLDELPAALLQPEQGAGVNSELEEEATATWLDELSAQLAESEESGVTSSLSSKGGPEDERDESSADWIED
jgi:hypothetical protein